jgi:hypothetical protein
MTGRDIVREFYKAVASLHDDGHVDRLKALGIPDVALFGPRPIVGVAAVETGNDGWFQVSDHGELMLVIADGVPDGVGWRTIDDVVAIDPSIPSRWWRLTGNVDVLGCNLNADKIDYSITIKEPISLYASPTEWLQHGGDGLCVLDWSATLTHVFRGLPVRCSPAIARRLRAKVRDEALAQLVIDIQEVRHAIAA